MYEQVSRDCFIRLICCLAVSLKFNSYVIWVPEGSLAGICWCHEVALELVCGADLWCKIRCKKKSRRSRGVLDPSVAEKRPRLEE